MIIGLFLIIIHFQGALISHKIHIYNVVDNNGGWGWEGVNTHSMTTFFQLLNIVDENDFLI
jgi:hypothetical protein